MKTVKKVTKEEPNNQKKENKNLSEDLLSSYRSALYKVKEFFDNIKFNPEDTAESIKIATAVVSVGASLGKAIETLAVLEKKVAADEGINSKVRGSADVGMFE